MSCIHAKQTREYETLEGREKEVNKWRWVSNVISHGRLSIHRIHEINMSRCALVVAAHLNTTRKKISSFLTSIKPSNFKKRNRSTWNKWEPIGIFVQFFVPFSNYFNSHSHFLLLVLSKDDHHRHYHQQHQKCQPQVLFLSQSEKYAEMNIFLYSN